MPAIQGRTREQLRQHIGYALGGLYVSAASSSGSTTTLLDNTLVLGGAAVSYTHLKLPTIYSV